MYCYNENGICPYWSIKENLPEQENGYCSFLGKSDYELNRVERDIFITHYKEEGKKIKTVERCGPNNPFFLSLLWDQCKDGECPKQEEI